MKTLTRKCARAFLMLVFAWTISVAWTSEALAADLPIYSDSLSSNWADWSWDVTRNFSSSGTTHNGSAAALAVTIDKAWGALYLHANSAVDVSGYDQIRFWVHGGTAGGQKLQLVANGKNNVIFTASANAWSLVSVSLTALGSPSSLTDLYFADASGGPQPVFYLDDITLIQRPVVPTVDLSIYGNSLVPIWADWSWSSTRNFANTATAHSAPNAIAITISAGWGALYLHSDTPVDTYGYGQLRFWVNGGASGGQQLQVAANSFAQPYLFTASANTWTQVSVPLSALGNPASIADLYWADATGVAQPTFYLDDIVLATGAAASQSGPGPTLSVNASSGRHAISDGIYGMNLLEEPLAAELYLPVRRWGGNQTSRYNWQNDTSNTGNDWYFENIPNDNANPALLPDGSATDLFVEQDRRTGTRSLITVPTIGWVAKRRSSGHPFDCGFKVSKYGAQQSTDTWDPDCGNGITTSSKNLTGNDPTDTSLAIDPSFISSWLGHFVKKYGAASNGGVAYYALDNEPMIWHSTHRDVHPLAPTYDEIRDRGFQYGAAIKTADPSAKVFGPVEWGWCAYLYSGADNCAPGADYQAHGSVPFAAWYLQQMHAYEQQHGQRILDYFDLHYYPAANNVSLAPAGDTATQALRLRSTRSLWDASYVDESWISTTVANGVAVQLLPRMKQWVADNYPGTKLAVTEYNWGGLESINGALTQADVLGIFGREGLDLATLWGPPTTAQPGAFAFRMFRNYDGAGHGFGDTSVQAISGDQSSLAIYAAQRSSDGATTIMVINKTSGDLTSSIALSGLSTQASASVYRYSPSNLAAIEHPADQTVTAGSIAATFPAQSITLYVLKSAGNFALPQSGWWWNPAESGRGFSIEVNGSNLFMASYLYDASGRALWYASGGALNADGSYSGQLQEYAGGQTLTGSYQPATVKTNATAVGLFCNTATSCNLTWAGGTVPIQRFAFDSSTTPTNAPQTGWWWNAAESGRGYFLEMQGSTLFATSYMYDTAGNALWYLTAGPSLASTFSGKWTQYTNGQTLTGGYHAATVMNDNVGPVSFLFSDPAHATLTLPDGRQIAVTRFAF